MRTTRFPRRAAGPADRLSDFMAHLRQNGLAVGVAETADALAALGAVEATDPRVARLALQPICARDAEQVRRFDTLFDAYWYNTGRERPGQAATPRPDHVRSQFSSARRPADGADEEAIGTSPSGADDGSGEAAKGEGRLVASRTARLDRTDLRELADRDELAQAEQVATRLARAIRDRRSRRRRAAVRGQRLDLRRILRSSLARGGDPVDLHRRRTPDRPMRIVALLDVSGSMTVYARVFLAFLKGLISADTSTDAYLFHTRLVRITDALRDRDTLRAAGRLSLMAQGFGGGTRIGASLASFADLHAAKAVNRRTVVIILSDGYDTDPPAVLAAQLARLARRAGRIVWLNPLLGWRDYAPVAAGMAAALPHLDAFLAANTLAGLAALEPELKRL